MKVYSQIVRLYLDISFENNSNFKIIEKQAHYLLNVMRIRVGSRIFVFNGFEGEFIAEVVQIKNHTVECKLLEKMRHQQDEEPLQLIFALVKKDRIFNIIEKCTELGVTSFQPVITERTQNHNYNLDKLRLYAIEASEQTRRLTIPKINDIQNLNLLINDWDANKSILFCNENDGISFMNIRNNLGKPVSILVGPEGGFSKKELDFLNSFNFIQSISLGPRVLRSDTAAISSVSCYQSKFGDWN